MNFTTHSVESAPQAAKPILKKTEQALGFVPNMLGGMAEAPALVEGYVTLSSIFDKTSFDAAQRQVILLTVSRFNECHYCMAAHSGIASMQQVDPTVIDAVRNDEPIPDPHLEALRRFTRIVVEKRGWVSEQNLEDFLQAGYSRSQVLEVILGVGVKTLSNYSNHILNSRVDDAFSQQTWSPPHG